MKLGDENVSGSTSVDVLGVKIDNLNLDEHISKLHALARISKY